MASGVTKVADIINPAIFTPYTQGLTEEKSRLINSGALVRSDFIDGLLAGGGNVFSVPSFKDLDNDADNVSTDDETSDSTPNKIGTALELAVRKSRNNSWSSMDLAEALAGTDPMLAIANRVAAYWERRRQVMFVALMAGLFADNDAAPTGTDTHTAGDLTNDIKAGAYSAGVTDFSAEAVIDTAVTMGDSSEALGMIMMHSVIHARAEKNNLIDFIPDARGEVTIPTFLGRRVIVDDGLPVSGAIYETWLFGTGALRLGVGQAKVPTEVDRKPAAGDGGGQDVLHNRVEWTLHPVGHAYIGTTPSGGPSNAATANNLAAAASWSRVWPERKQIKIARLITREA